LGVIGVVGGAVTVVLAAISFAGRGSIEDFFLRLGLAALVLFLAAVLYMFSLRSRDQPSEAPGDSSLRVENRAADDAEPLAFVIVAVGGLLLFVVAIGALMAGDFSPRAVLFVIGFWTVLALPIVLIAGRREIIAWIREVSKPSRSCPRCGHSVKHGVMRCPSCDFDFWTVGGGRQR
jgi:TRAP-type C4-dicarboxylate transport system permease large subunit